MHIRPPPCGWPSGMFQFRETRSARVRALSSVVRVTAVKPPVSPLAPALVPPPLFATLSHRDSVKPQSHVLALFLLCGKQGTTRVLATPKCRPFRVYFLPSPPLSSLASSRHTSPALWSPTPTPWPLLGQGQAQLPPGCSLCPDAPPTDSLLLGRCLSVAS